MTAWSAACGAQSDSDEISALLISFADRRQIFILRFPHLVAGDVAASTHDAQLVASAPDNLCMQIQHEPWGAIVVMWAEGRFTLLFDARDAWFTWDGRLVRCIAVGSA